MMAEYIDREALMRDARRASAIVCGMADIFDIECLVYDQPACDVVKVQRGSWFFTEHEYFSCSKCGASYYNGCDSTYEAKEKLRNGEYHNYCHRCGAKMDGKGEGE